MKTIDHTFTTVTRTVCPFCNYGCEFGIVFNDFGIAGIEYMKEGSSGGRLCPRGSAAAMYLNHKQRLSVPFKQNAPYDANKMLKDLKRIIEKPEQMAITFDRNITIEEYQAIIGFCRAVGIDRVASAYLESESLLKRCASGTFQISDVNSADTVCIIGDIFSHTPMCSKAFIEWKRAHRKHRLIVIDSIHTHTSSFASDFIKVMPGTESLLFFALAHEDIKGIDVSEHTGISRDRIAEISGLMKNAKQGLIAVCLPSARTYDPLLFVEGLKRFSSFYSAKVAPFVEFQGFEGNRCFGAIMEDVKKGTVKQIINFGELFPFYYPQIVRDMKKVPIFATSPLKWNGYTMIPGALNLEKKGTINTLFGPRDLSGVIAPPSGSQDVVSFLAGIKKSDPSQTALAEPDPAIDIVAQAQRLIDQKTTKKKKALTLFGEKTAYHFLGLFDHGSLKINPHDAQELGIKAHDIITVKSKQGAIDIDAAVTADVDPGIVAIPVEEPHVRALFNYDIVDHYVSLVPTEVEICQKG
ncbi:hypothetical protein JXB22_05125 [candidate division WOR-3 bacterium]|nr:hypothetical protein [candidate division WOR-3 bacterium]